MSEDNVDVKENAENVPRKEIKREMRQKRKEERSEN